MINLGVLGRQPLLIMIFHTYSRDRMPSAHGECTRSRVHAGNSPSEIVKTKRGLWIRWLARPINKQETHFYLTTRKLIIIKL